MDNYSSDEDARDDVSSVLDQAEIADESKKRIAYFYSCKPDANQFDRYEIFHKFTFIPKAPDQKPREEKFMRLVNTLMGTKVTNENVRLLLSSTAKLYVSRLVETSLEIAAQQDYHGPLQPEHVMEARRRTVRKREAILE